MFITVEGIDGSGKTTFTTEFLNRLSELGVNFSSFREPGGSEVGNHIREILINPEINLSPLTEYLLLMAGRSANVENNILPNLKAGKMVVSDRYIDSSYAYQLAGGLKEEQFLKVIEAFDNFVWPNLTIYIDIKPQDAWERVKARKESISDFESRGGEYFNKVASNYDKMIAEHPYRFKVINNDGSIEDFKELARKTADEISMIFNSSPKELFEMDNKKFDGVFGNYFKCDNVV